MTNPYKDSQGRWRTQSLFLEASYSQDALYTMKDEDSNGLPSFRRRYLELADPTEHRQATELLGGWEHWQALLKSKWFLDYITPIRDELEIQLKSEAVMVIRDIMVAKDKSSMPAAKAILDGCWKETKRGRPTKEEVEGEKKMQAEIARRVEEDHLRLVGGKDKKDA